MDTKPLERFATWARRELINAVEAQATAVLAVGSVARSEGAEVIRKLEAEIARHGRQQVVDKVAYIWFNRIIALRFMDARGYTDAAVVSPAQGQAHGQPEVLADAKRGNLDADIVTNTRTANAIIGLLDGTRRSTDAEGEAYALLLTEYCRYWHKPMPFMFEREGDYTELLVPANLLADGAILARAREVLTEDVCDDVEVIGWLYQFYISERKAEVFAGFKKNKKAGAEELPAATQLFTPHWIVRYLVENSLGRLWMLNRPMSRLAERMDYYIAPADEEANFLTITGPEELTVIDPACGSGHMLTYAFDLLYAIYEEEGYAPSDIPGLILTHNLHGTEIDARAGALAAFALTMKARARHRSFFNKQIKPNICVIEPITFEPNEVDFLMTRGGDRQEEEIFWSQFEHADTLGSLIQPDAELARRLKQHIAHLDDGGDIFHAGVLDWAKGVLLQAAFLSVTYAVVIANPPYMGAGNMGSLLSTFAKENYPASKTDLFAMFIERCMRLAGQSGQVAMITMQSWMFLASFEKLRSRIIQYAPPANMAHLGERAFDSIGGAVVSTTAFVLQVGRSLNEVGSYIRLVDGRTESQKSQVLLAAAKNMGPSVFRSTGADFSEIPGTPIVYWLSEDVRRAFKRGRPLGDVAELREGLSSSDSDRFMRLWWEVSTRSRLLNAPTPIAAKESGAKWFPFNKGGEFRKWYGNHEYLINWQNAGAEILDERPKSTVRSPQYYFRSCVSWSKISTGSPAFRSYPEGFVLGSAAKSVYVDSEQTSALIMSICNSSLVQLLLAAKSPTMSFVAEDVGSLPILAIEEPGDLLARVEELRTNSMIDWDESETSWNFGFSPIHASGSDQTLAEIFDGYSRRWASISLRQQALEEANNMEVVELYELDHEVQTAVPLDQVTLTHNMAYRYSGKSEAERTILFRQDSARDLVSYAIGCIVGRYSVDEPGLILADQGGALPDYLTKVPVPTFMPDTDNVIPFVDDGWFEDDVVERFRQFLRAGFGTKHFEENLRFLEESLGVKTLRDYFITRSGVSKFYADHVQRYKKRPIYWMFSSSKGSFNALIYMHRYTPSTVSTVLNEYLREYRAKLEVALANAEQAAAGGGSAKEQKEADRLRKVLLELAEYEHDVLYPLATQQIAIDLDDGVKANYPKFYPALKNIAGLEATE